MDPSNSSPAHKLPRQWTGRTEPGINLKKQKNLTKYLANCTDTHYKHTDSHFQSNEGSIGTTGEGLKFNHVSLKAK